MSFEADEKAARPRLVSARPDAGQVHEAVRTILAWIGEDPDREGLQKTPERVIRAYAEFFPGAGLDPHQILSPVFSETDGYQELVLLRRIRFSSFCEHHMLPFQGEACVGYVPHDRVVGISKLARLVDFFARRLQIQERMTVQIAAALMEVLQPAGVGVWLRATHTCMTLRGVCKEDSVLTTSHYAGVLATDPARRGEFLRQITGE